MAWHLLTGPPLTLIARSRSLALHDSTSSGRASLPLPREETRNNTNHIHLHALLSLLKAPSPARFLPFAPAGATHSFQQFIPVVAAAQLPRFPFRRLPRGPRTTTIVRRAQQEPAADDREAAAAALRTADYGAITTSCSQIDRPGIVAVPYLSLRAAPAKNLPALACLPPPLPG